MESPLLGDETGGWRNSGRLPRFDRRSDAITHGSPYQKAAALVDLVFLVLCERRTSFATQF